MSHYTVLDNSDVQTILSQYTTETVSSYKVLSGGSENTNYLVNTENKAFVLTICEQKSPEEAKNLACLLEYLHHNSFATSKVQKSKSEAFIAFWNDKPIMLKQFIEGNITRDFPNNLLIYLGTELAKLHHIKAPNYVSQTLSYGNVKRFDDVQDYAPDSNFYKWIKDTKHYIEKYISSDLPKALIHSDIFYSNIIVDTDQGTCRDQEAINLNKVAFLLEGYQKEISLLDIEKKALKAFTVYAATATAIWRHHNFNYVNIIPEKKDHYLEMKLLADAVMNMPDNCFIE